jgi:hypothetical protein
VQSVLVCFVTSVVFSLLLLLLLLLRFALVWFCFDFVGLLREETQ